jgi:phosphatidylinositol glycan class A protein
MAKESIKWIPGLGWFMLMSGTVFINRGNHKSAIASMTHAGEDMKRKRVSEAVDNGCWVEEGSRAEQSQISLWIFPEGTRHLSAQSDLLPFKKGAFYLAVQGESILSRLPKL